MISLPSCFCKRVEFIATGIFFVGLMFFARAVSSEPLFERGSPKVEDVLQGTEGTCYVHATLAALAHTKPKLIKEMIELRSDGAYLVHFKYPTVSTEVVYLDDAKFARKYGFDRSHGGLWVPILLRATALKLLRARIDSTIPKLGVDTTQMFLLQELFAGERLVYLDRFIRDWIQQNKVIDAIKWADYLRRIVQATIGEWTQDKNAEQILMAHLEDGIALLEGSQLESQLISLVRDYILLWGAYRTIGSGGSILEPFVLFFGKSQQTSQLSTLLTKKALLKADSFPVVAATKPNVVSTKLTPRHAYTVLGVENGLVMLRNPWGHTPANTKGIIKITYQEFVHNFRSIVVLVEK